MAKFLLGWHTKFVPSSHPVILDFAEPSIEAREVAVAAIGAG
jgi:hypothetical protein